MFRKLLSLLSDVAIYGISSMLSQLIGFMLVPLYTRYLTPADQGMITQVIIISSFFGPIANLGMINAIFRRFNLDKDEQERRRVLTTGLFSVTISSLILLTITFFFAPEIVRLAVGDQSAVSLLRIALVTAGVSSIGMVPMSILRADRRVKTTAAVNIFKLLLSVGFTIWLIVEKQWGMWGVLVGTLIGEATTAVLLLAITSRSFRLCANMTTWRRLASYGLPFVPHQIQGMAMGLLPQFLIGPMLGLEETGLYNYAIKFTAPIVFVVGSVQNAWVAYKFQIHAEDDNPASFFRSAVTYYVAGLVYLWVGASLWGPEALWLLADESYHPAAWLIPIAGLIPVAQGFYFMMGTGMELSDDTRPFPLVTLIGLITAMVSVFIFVPRLGTAGAAVASINSFIALTVVIFYFSQRRFTIHYDWQTLIAIFALGAGAVIIGYAELGRPGVERIPMAIAISVVFPVLEFCVLLRSRSERYRMRVLWSKLAKT